MATRKRDRKRVQITDPAHATDVLGHILTGLLAGIQALDEAVTGHGTPNDPTSRPHGLRAGIAQIKHSTNALYALDCAARCEPVLPGDPLFFTNGRRQR
jgi:hypothetical protein